MSARRRVLIAVAIGTLVGVVVASVGPWQLAVLAGFDGWALAQLIWLGVFVLPLDAAQTKARARSEDDSKTSAFLAIITAAVISLVGVIVALVKAQHVAHAQKVLVKPGQKVKAGQAIALEGTTGDSTGPHLHFEIHHGLWNQVDPAPWLRAHGVKVGC